MSITNVRAAQVFIDRLRVITAYTNEQLPRWFPRGCKKVHEGMAVAFMLETLSASSRQAGTPLPEWLEASIADNCKQFEQARIERGFTSKQHLREKFYQ